MFKWFQRYKARRILIKSKKLIENGWCQEAMARNSNGTPVDHIYDRSAVSYCLLGAVSKQCGKFDFIGDRKNLVYISLIDAASCRSLSEYNDTPGRTKEEVLEVFDKAIGSLK